MQVYIFSLYYKIIPTFLTKCGTMNTNITISKENYKNCGRNRIDKIPILRINDK